MSAQAALDQALAGLHKHSTPEELRAVYERHTSLGIAQLAAASDRSTSWVSKQLHRVDTRMRPRGGNKPAPAPPRQVDASPTVLKHRLCQRLMELRTGAGLTQIEAAHAAGVSHATLMRAENPEKALTQHLLRTLTACYDTPDQVREELLRIWQDSRARPWWAEQGLRVPRDRQTVLGLHADARRVYGWSDTLVPELAQTTDYARTIEASHGDEEPVQMAVAVLIAAQRRVRRRGIDQRYVLDEAVIRRGVGGAQVMADQLKGLRQLAVRGRLRVLAWDSGQYSPVGGFELCFVPELGTALYKPRTQQISVPGPSDTPSLDFFRTALTHLWEHAADAAATTALIDHARAQLLGAQASDVHTTAS